VVARICGDVTGTLIISFNDRGQTPKPTVFYFQKAVKKFTAFFIMFLSPKRNYKSILIIQCNSMKIRGELFQIKEHLCL
jgi:hypothetical protein